MLGTERWRERMTKQCWVRSQQQSASLDEEIIPRIDCVYILIKAADFNPWEWDER